MAYGRLQAQQRARADLHASGRKFRELTDIASVQARHFRIQRNPENPQQSFEKVEFWAKKAAVGGFGGEKGEGVWKEAYKSIILYIV